MDEIQVENETELIEKLKQSKAYSDFKRRHLQSKIEREIEAWKLIENNRGKYSKDVLIKIFDKVDLFDGNKRWLGSLLATPNRNLIFQSDLDIINQWFETLLFTNQDEVSAINLCLKNFKIRGASKGLATLLLYLSSPTKFNIWVNATQDGLTTLGRIKELKGNDFGKNYSIYNEHTIAFRNQYDFQPQELDWIFTFISSYVESADTFFSVSREALETPSVEISVDDESEIDEVVGEPMDLRVMRWAPTNEMGVVALFIEFRKELGFPHIEIIRTRFPDAAVFEQTSNNRFVRKYIEFEFKSSGYKSHLKSKRKCHYVVCWENDWKDCPIPVVELKKQIPNIILK
jgi:hypothetical protein